MARLASPLFAAVLSASPAAAETGGRVTSADSRPVERAQILDSDTGNKTYSDNQGHFALPQCELPCLLVVSHPRFEDHVVELSGPPARQLEVVLEAKQTVYEQIQVTASGGASAFTPVSVASTLIDSGERAARPATLTELVEGVAGVAENGQGGVFQTFSIRGVSRHRVLTLVEGMPITGERRAGVSTSFIDPLLMDSVEVVRGPSSTFYGSGALGGVVQVFPRRFERAAFETGYDSTGDARFLTLGGSAAGWSLGLAHRQADSSETADGRESNSGFTQTSAVLAREWQSDKRTYELLVIPTYGEDIGKPNTDFPDRATVYPRERHLLLRFGMTTDSGSSFHAFFHPNDLDTLVTEDSEESLVRNRAFDLGAGWQRQWTLGKDLSARLAASYSGRRGISATETGGDLPAGMELRTLDGARQDELAVAASARRGWGRSTVLAGTRLTWQEQSNAGFESRDDSSWTGFLGWVRPLSKGVELTVNVGTGLRFPNLSERFFSGTTGRGGQIGNPDLEPESSLGYDAGLRWFGKRAFVAAQVFRLDIDDYIERIELDDGVRTFVNLTSGILDGIETEGFFQPDERWHFSWSAHVLSGEAEDGTPLSDVPADRLQLGARYQQGSWEGRLRLQLRAEEDEPGGGEKAIPAAELLSASVAYRLSEGLWLSLRGTNLLDELYFSSADRRAEVGPGRAFGLSLRWDAPGPG